MWCTPRRIICLLLLTFCRLTFNLLSFYFIFLCVLCNSIWLQNKSVDKSSCISWWLFACQRTYSQRGVGWGGVGWGVGHFGSNNIYGAKTPLRKFSGTVEVVLNVELMTHYSTGLFVVEGGEIGKYHRNKTMSGGHFLISTVTWTFSSPT